MLSSHIFSNLLFLSPFRSVWICHHAVPVSCPHQFIQGHRQSPVLCFSFVSPAQICYRELYMKACDGGKELQHTWVNNLNLNKWITFPQVHQLFLFWVSVTLYFFLGPWTAAMFAATFVGLRFHFMVSLFPFTLSPQIHLPPISKKIFSKHTLSLHVKFTVNLFNGKI